MKVAEQLTSLYYFNYALQGGFYVWVFGWNFFGVAS